MEEEEDGVVITDEGAAAGGGGEKRTRRPTVASAAGGGGGVKRDSPSKQFISRLEWTEELHRLFVASINALGPTATPVTILEEMKVEGVTRENVASHLQKYRKKMRQNLPPEHDQPPPHPHPHPHTEVPVVADDDSGIEAFGGGP